MGRMFGSLLLFMTMLISCVAPETVLSTQAPTTPTSTSLPSVTDVAYFDGDGGLISQNPCGPPCFMDVLPGETNKTEVTKLLVEKGIFDSCTSIDDFHSLIYPDIGGWSCSSSLTIRYQISDEIVNYIGFVLADPVTLGNVVEKQGFPDYVELIDTGFPENPTFMIRLYYLNKMILFLNGAYEATNFEVLPTTLIEGATYFDQQLWQEDIDRFRDYLVPWKGYGEYP